MPSADRDGLRIAAVVLAAGMSSRMGTNKLLAELGGEPLVRRVVRSVQSSRARPVVVVVGHDNEAIEAALAGLEATVVHNADFRSGLGTSLRAGIRAVANCEGALIVLGDMPDVSSALLDKVISAFNPQAGHAICVPTFRGRRGNPVLFARRFFSGLEAIAGDVGARAIVESHAALVCEVEAGDDGPLIDVDTPEDLQRFVRPS